MSEQFEENPTVQARKWSNRWQGIYLKLKELNVVTHDHTYLELHKSGKEGKLDLGTRKIICTNKELALRSSLGEESIIQGSINESLLTAEQVSTFTTPAKWQTYLKKSNDKKNWTWRTDMSVMQPNHKHTVDWLWLPKSEWCEVQLLGPCNVHGFSWCRRWDIQENYILMSHT